jgi:hypothetical protein
MDKIIFKTLNSKKETGLVLEKIEMYSGVRLPLNYAKDSKIVGAFLHNQLVASYMLVTKPNYRSVMFVPDETKESNTFFKKDQYDFMEVNGLWISPALKTPSLQVRIWMNLIKDIFFCKKKYILLMRNKKNRSMERFLNMANPSILFEGSPLKMAGQSTYDEIQVSFTSRWKILLNFHKYFMEFRNRQRRAENFATQQNYVEI